MANNNPYSFLIFVNPKINVNSHLNEIIQFEIDRISSYHKNSCNIYDYFTKSSINNSSGTKIFSSELELQEWFESIKDTSSGVFLVDSTNPFLDFELIHYLMSIFEKNIPIVPYGCIPGTAPNILASPEFLIKNYSKELWEGKFPKNARNIYWDTQRKHNTLFDLNRPLRIKIFSALLKKIENLHKLSIDEFIKILDREDIFNFILNYAFENLNSHDVTKCPYCHSTELKPLRLSTSQTMIGFLSSNKPHYYECMSCSLVVLIKQCNDSDIHKLYDEYERPKQNEEELINAALNGKGFSHFQEKVKGIKLLQSVLSSGVNFLDLGGGFGEFSCLVKAKNPSWNVSCADFSLDHIKNILEKNKVKGINKNFLKEDFGSNFDAISALHVIEHIPFSSLLPFLKNIHTSLNDGGYLLLTTPNFDSPIGKLFDYHLMYPPHHQTILSANWLVKFLEKNNLFRLIKQESASIILEKYTDWFTYYKNTSPTDEARSLVQLFDFIKLDPIAFKEFEEKINSNNLGSETILLFQK